MSYLPFMYFSALTDFCLTSLFYFKTLKKIKKISEYKNLWYSKNNVRRQCWYNFMENIMKNDCNQWSVLMLKPVKLPDDPSVLLCYVVLDDR